MTFRSLRREAVIFDEKCASMTHRLVRSVSPAQVALWVLVGLIVPPALAQTGAIRVIALDAADDSPYPESR